LAQPTKHPSTEKLRRETCRRWLALKRDFEVHVNLMRCGMFAMNFNDVELGLLADTGMVSEWDEMLLKRAGRKPIRRHEAKEP
jgi:hypothetical protein